MKKTYAKIKEFLQIHLKIAVFITIFCGIAGVSAIKYSQNPFVTCISATMYALSILTLYRFFTYKYGSLPILYDYLEMKFKRRYSPKEASKMYSQASFKRASLYFTLEIVALTMFVVCETLVLIVGILT